MRVSKKLFNSIILTLFVAILAVIFSLTSFADASFENEIKDFPESYKPYLRELHEKYPEWEFRAMETGLDWQESVEAQTGDQSLVYAVGDYSDIFKSREIGDYIASTDTYIQKDGGFVTANSLAVSYYMDPRNFLNVEGIFQFEDLTFDPAYTVNEVEIVLSGNFMHNKKVSYYDKNGKLINANYTYAEYIYVAGKTYDINPCYLASKIRNEIGNGSGSVSGKYSGYEGIYNFYNIGAYDGANAIANGLEWASTGTTYGRPWTSPQKSIFGGAEFIAQNYIAKGQFTGYLQRFNVNPDSYYKPHTHQYMTNLTGATSQGYSTYLSYLGSGSLNKKCVFSIPVYENMSAEDSGSGNILLNDSTWQYAKVTADYLNVRLGPSTSYGKLDFQITKGTTVKVYDKVPIDSKYYDSILRYPYWAKILIIQNSKSYIGYVPMDYIAISSYTSVPTGTFDLDVLKSSSDINVNYVSSDSSVARVNSNNTISFLKAGTVEITAYDSFGKYDKVLYKVESNAKSRYISNLSVTQTSSEIQVKFSKNSLAQYYEIFAVDNDANILGSVVTQNNYASFKIEDIEGTQKILVRTLTKYSNAINCYGMMSEKATAIKPSKVQNVKLVGTTYNSIKVQWDKVTSSDGYRIFVYEDGKWIKYETFFDPNVTSYEFKSLERNTQYSIRVIAFVLSDDVIWGDYSNYLDVKTSPANLEKVTISSATSTDSSIKINWKKVDGVSGYRVYHYDNGAWVSLINIFDPNATSYTITNLRSNLPHDFIVRTFSKVGDTYAWGSSNTAFTAMTKVGKVDTVALDYVRVTSDEATVKWKSIDNVSGYRVYIKINGTWIGTNIFDREETSYTFKNLNSNQTYEFAVRAFTQNGDGYAWGDLSKIISIKTQYAKPATMQIKAVYTSSSAVRIDWNKLSGVTGYRVYIYINNEWVGENIFNANTETFMFTGLRSNTEFSFIVRAFTQTDDGYLWGDLSKTAVGTTKVGKVDDVQITGATSTTSTVELKWEKIDNVSGYRVYIYQNGTWVGTNIFDKNVSSYTFKNLKSNTKYYFTVRAFTKNGDSYVWSENFESFPATTKK